MKTTFKIFAIGAGLGLACDGGEDADGGPAVAEADAQEVAARAVGGTALSATLDESSDPPLWEVDIEMGNGGAVEAYVHAETADLVELEAFSGPFDYEFTPVDGVMSYTAMMYAGLEEVDGEIEAWKFEAELDEGEYEWEFYIRDEDGQLWEIKFDAVDGTATELEQKDAVDE